MKKKNSVDPFGVASQERDFPRTGETFGPGAAPGDVKGFRLHISQKQ